MHPHCAVRLCLPKGVSWSSLPFPHVYPHVFPSTNVVCFLFFPRRVLDTPVAPAGLGMEQGCSGLLQLVEHQPQGTPGDTVPGGLNPARHGGPMAEPPARGLQSPPQPLCSLRDAKPFKS